MGTKQLMSVEFSEEFALDVALGYAPTADLLAHWDMGHEEYAALRADETFNRVVATHAQILVERGVTASLRARIALRNSIQTLYRVSEDFSVSATERRGAIEMMMQIAGWMDGKKGLTGIGSTPAGSAKKRASEEDSQSATHRPTWGINIVMGEPPKRDLNEDPGVSRADRNFNVPIPDIIGKSKFDIPGDGIGDDNDNDEDEWDEQEDAY